MKQTSYYSASNGLKNCLALLVWLAGSILFFLAPASVRADVIPSDKKNINYCFELTNTAAFPDYTYVLYLGGPGGHTVLSGPDCYSPGRYGDSKLFAVKKSDFTEKEIPANGPGEKEYLTKNAKFIPAPVSIDNPRLVDKSDQRTAIVDVMKVADISPAGLKIEKVTVRYTYQDGKTEEIPYQNQSVRPLPGSGAASSSSGESTSPATATGDQGSLSWLWFAALPAVALITILGVILLRRQPTRR